MGGDIIKEIQVLNDALKSTKDGRERDRIRGIILIKKGYNVHKIADIMNVSVRTIYNWKKRYEKNGTKGLKTKRKPGRKGKLSPEDVEKLIKLLKQKDCWTTREAKELIKNEFGIEYTLRHVARILRKIGMVYQKPFVHDYRRPDNAEEILKKE